jgi:hypothetical protein
VEIDPAGTRLDQLDPDWVPIGLDEIPMAPQDLQSQLLMFGVDGEVEVTMCSGLLPDQRVDTQPPPTQTRQLAPSSEASTSSTSDSAVCG